MTQRVQLHSRSLSSFCFHSVRCIYACVRLDRLSGKLSIKTNQPNLILLITAKYGVQFLTLALRFFLSCSFCTSPRKKHPSSVHILLDGNFWFADCHKINHSGCRLILPYLYVRHTLPWVAELYSWILNPPLVCQGISGVFTTVTPSSQFRSHPDHFTQRVQKN